MPLHLLLLSMVLLEPAEVSTTSCLQVLHSKSPALELRCCIFDHPQPHNYDGGKCSPRHKCHCLLEVAADQLMDCSSATANHSLTPDGLKVQHNHSLATEQEPKFGNSVCQHFLSSLPSEREIAEFSLHIRHWKQSQCLELLNGISKYNVTSLTVHFKHFSPLLHSEEVSESLESSETTVEFPNIGLFLPRLKYLNIGNKVNEQVKHVVRISSNSFLRDLSYLEILKVINVDFEVGTQKEEGLWTRSIQLIHIENSSLSYLPWWMSKCHRLERLIIRSSQVHSALVLSQIPSLVYLDLRGNQLEDLSHISFSCERVQQIDLSENFLVKIAPHTFRQCALLRSLDLSYNFLDSLPHKGFIGNGKLKHLKLRNNRIRFLRPDHFAGLPGLRSLILSGNPLQNEDNSQGITASGIEPFALLPVKWLRSLELDDCSLTSIPLAVTQCCLLNSLSLNSNRLYTRESMPAEILALLSKLTYLGFERNPLKELPSGLFLFPIDSEAAIVPHILDTLIQLPLWLDEPCTPYLWHLHLRNSSYEMRQRVAGWNVSRMHREKLGHCQQLYENILEGQTMYRELAENSGCEASRKLRSAKQLSTHTSGTSPTSPSPSACSCPKQSNTPSNQSNLTSGQGLTTSTVRHNVAEGGAESTTPVSQGRSLSTTYLMLTSLAANFGLFLVLVVQLVRTATRKILLSPSFCTQTKEEEQVDDARTSLKKTAKENKIAIYTNEDLLSA